MNKLKEILKPYLNFKDHCIHRGLPFQVSEINLMSEFEVGLLNYLDEQSRIPSLEQIKKEWEELGYEFTIYTAEDDTMRKFDISKNGEKIILWYDHSYSKVGNTDHCFTIQEHNLLTKTFKALGW